MLTSTVKSNTIENLSLPKRPQLVEIVGPAGAGKTTLCRELSRVSSQVCMQDFPDVRKRDNASFFIRYGLQIVPELFRSFRPPSRVIHRREFAWLTILKGWSDLLQREVSEHDKLIMLDQGPVYLLTEIFEFGPNHLKTQHAENLRRALYHRWSHLLDVVVWLDATDASLLKRINSRDKDHVVKNASKGTAVEFLDRYRAAYECTLSMLLRNNPNLQILQFDTSAESPSQIANHLLVEFGMDHHQPQ